MNKAYQATVLSHQNYMETYFKHGLAINLLRLSSGFKSITNFALIDRTSHAALPTVSAFSIFHVNSHYKQTSATKNDNRERSRLNPAP